MVGFLVGTIGLGRTDFGIRECAFRRAEVPEEKLRVVWEAKRRDSKDILGLRKPQWDCSTALPVGPGRWGFFQAEPVRVAKPPPSIAPRRLCKCREVASGGSKHSKTPETVNAIGYLERSCSLAPGSARSHKDPATFAFLPLERPSSVFHFLTPNPGIKNEFLRPFSAAPLKKNEKSRKIHSAPAESLKPPKPIFSPKLQRPKTALFLTPSAQQQPVKGPKKLTWIYDSPA